MENKTARFMRRRQSLLISWLLGFGGGMLVMAMLVMAILANGTAGGHMSKWTEERTAVVTAAEETALPVVFYNDKGQKVCVRQDAVLELEKTLRMELPLRQWKPGEKGLLELHLYFEDGTVLSGRLTVQKSCAVTE